MHNHDEAWCFVNPASSVFKPEVRARRVKQAEAKGVTVPAYLKEAVPSQVGAAMPPFLLNGVEDALRMVGSLTEEEVQAQTDAIIEGWQN
jgi:hypothetical protein